VVSGVVIVPVNVGEATGARLVSAGCTWSAFAGIKLVPTAAVPFISGVIAVASVYVAVACPPIPTVGTTVRYTVLPSTGMPVAV
jgi:hypothetical protein